MKIISKSKDGKRAQVVIHGEDQHGKKTSRTHHVRLDGGKWVKPAQVAKDGTVQERMEVAE